MSINRTVAWTGVAALSFGMLVLGLATTSNGQGPNGGHSVKASELIGLGVRASGDDEKGKIKDLMIGADGRVEYAAISFGGFMGMGDKLFAVPMDAIHLEWKNNKISHAQVDVTEESIKQRKGFDSNHWPEQGEREFMTNGAGRVQPINH
jgi:PRC-barrel domain